MRTWRPSWPCPVGQILRPRRRGAADPTFRTDPDGTVWLGLRTPAGTATLRLLSRPADGEVDAEAWGDGAGWALDAVPTLLGADDDPRDFPADRHPAVARLHRSFRNWRPMRTGLVMDALVPGVLEQKVTGVESHAGFRALVHRHGERAPGPGGARRLWVQPAPHAVADVPAWEWPRLAVGPQRAATLRHCATLADSLERLAARTPAEADRGLRSVPGIGVWTSAEVRSRVHGDPDAVSLGDYNVITDIGWALTGEILDDDAVAELLEPFRGHRYRVQRLVELSGVRRPRRGPRQRLRTHLPA